MPLAGNAFGVGVHGRGPWPQAQQDYVERQQVWLRERSVVGLALITFGICICNDGVAIGNCTVSAWKCPCSQRECAQRLWGRELAGSVAYVVNTRVACDQKVARVRWNACQPS